MKSEQMVNRFNELIEEMSEILQKAEMDAVTVTVTLTDSTAHKDSSNRQATVLLGVGGFDRIKITEAYQSKKFLFKKG